MSISAVITSKNVDFAYKKDLVLKNVSFEVLEGQFIGLIGPNGSGKTTLLKLILGLLKPQKGEIKVLGSPTRLGKFGSRLGYVPQKITQVEKRMSISVEEVVMLGRVSRRGLGKKFTAEDRKIATEAMREVGIWPLKDNLLEELSSGQQQKVFIARALAGLPELLILDEPTVGVDWESQVDFYEVLRHLNRKRGLTIILVSHDIEVVINEVDEVICLNKEIIYQGEPAALERDDYWEKLYGKGRRLLIHHHNCVHEDGENCHHLVKNKK